MTLFLGLLIALVLVVTFFLAAIGAGWRPFLIVVGVLVFIEVLHRTGG